MYYLTFNDQPSGIYQSQVIDVVKYLSKLSGDEVTLIAFLPVQGFKENKRVIRSHYKKSLILPMVFGISRWRKHKFLLKIFTNRKRSIMTRGPLANALSLGNFKKVVYDGRAAVKAEVEEYDITGGNKQLGDDFIETERAAVLTSDFRIAVSHKLVDYWKREFNYSENQHVVIPCTLTSVTKTNTTKEEKNNDKIKLVYSGSTSGWQSFDKVVELLDDLLLRQENIEVLFLTKKAPEIEKLIVRHPERVKRKFVAHNEVQSELEKCDYGILIRDDKVTNQVASPVKFAEYLNAGLHVLISENLGDFSAFVAQHQCGVITENQIPELNSITLEQRKNAQNLVEAYFMKNSELNKMNYIKLLDLLN
jgi:hypothetical protein